MNKEICKLHLIDKATPAQIVEQTGATRNEVNNTIRDLRICRLRHFNRLTVFQIIRKTGMSRSLVSRVLRKNNLMK